MTKQKNSSGIRKVLSDIQKDSSIDDQIGLCEQIARREGYKIVKVYSDRRSPVPACLNATGCSR